MWTADSSELRWRMPKAAKGFPEKFFAEVGGSQTRLGSYCEDTST